jgi:hypothetical protein
MFWGRRSKTNSAESRYLRGELRPRSDRPSVIHFTLHKCASVYLRSKLHALARKIDLAPVDLDGYFFDFARPERFTLQPRGFFYGPFRGLDDSLGVPRQWPDLSEYKVIIVLRDPRDVLTSLYFSIAYSHRTPRGDGREQFLSHRDQVRRIDIDDYVRQQAEPFYRRYRAYFDLAARYGAHLTTYEHLVTAPQAWLDELLAYLDVRLSGWTRRRLISPGDFAIDRENPAAHVRQVAPGDHARKLRPDTIAWLNAKFADVLEWYDARRTIQRAA